MKMKIVLCSRICVVLWITILNSDFRLNCCMIKVSSCSSYWCNIHCLLAVHWFHLLYAAKCIMTVAVTQVVCACQRVWWLWLMTTVDWLSTVATVKSASNVTWTADKFTQTCLLSHLTVSLCDLLLSWGKLQYNCNIIPEFSHRETEYYCKHAT